MNEKCNKYEGLFVFSDKETLEKHIAECEDCHKEAEQQEKVSELLDEVKLYYFAKKRRRFRLRAACAVIFLMFSFLSLDLVMTNDDLMDSLKYGDSLTAEDLGFPVDDYGLLMVDE